LGNSGKKISLKLFGAKKYWAHAGLIRLVQQRSRWDEQAVKDFLIKNEVVTFNNLDSSAIADILNELENAGFSISLSKGENEIAATLTLSYQDEITLVKDELSQLSERVLVLESGDKAKEQKESIRDTQIYQELKQQASHEAKQTPAETVKATLTQKIKTPKATTEAAIGKYWLSGIGVFTLLLGVVFFIIYYSRGIGAIGKLSIATIIGAALVMAGHYFSKREKYFRWAMFAVGGGWAVLYFTIFAAHHVAAVKVIHNPFIGFTCLLTIAACSIADSLRFKSHILIFMSYFLAYLSTITTDVSYYTLFASYVLAISIVVITRTLGVNWLALLGLVMVYLSHWIWVEPAISTAGFAFAGQERMWEAVVLPWMGDSWRIYPLIDVGRSVLHLSFLSLYWLLFAVLGNFRDNDKKKLMHIVLPLLLANNFIFVSSFIHHLHVYYPHMKWIFTLVMGGVFYGFCLLEKKRQWQLMSDIYLSSSMSLLCLMLPMCFGGPVITYGWTAVSLISVWLGFRQKKALLRYIGLTLSALVVIRLVCFDYLEREILFRVLMPVYPFFIIATTVSLAFYVLHLIYGKNKDALAVNEKYVDDIVHIFAVCIFGIAVLMGGLRAASSCVFVIEGIYLMYIGIKKKKKVYRVFSFVFFLLATLRMIWIDFGFELSKIFNTYQIALRYGGCLIAVLAFLKLTDWMREKSKVKEVETVYFKWFAGMIAVIATFVVIDKSLTSVLALMWGIIAFGFMVYGFWRKEKVYRVLGLILFGCVTARLFLHDFAQLEVFYRIISFMGLGVVFIVASLIYNHYSKLLLAENEDK
jgi:uncharacterized membrane protein